MPERPTPRFLGRCLIAIGAMLIMIACIGCAPKQNVGGVNWNGVYSALANVEATADDFRMALSATGDPGDAALADTIDQWQAAAKPVINLVMRFANGNMGGDTEDDVNAAVWALVDLSDTYIAAISKPDRRRNALLVSMALKAGLRNAGLERPPPPPPTESPPPPSHEP